MMDLAFILLAVAVQGGETDGIRLAHGPVNYWGTGGGLKPKKASEPRASVWLEPLPAADGRATLHVPPRAVLEFLDDPTEQTAAAYLEWQRERMSKLRRAMQILDDVARRDADAAPGKRGETVAIELLYFKQDNCGWCDAQDRVLTALRKERPALAVRAFDRTADPELWRRYDVTVTPTIVVRDGDATVATLRGLASAKSILAAVERRTK